MIADELNQDFSYVRSDLSTAYNRFADPADTPNRKLDFFYRNFLYLRAPNVFVVYDQVQAKPSSNPNRAYKKHIRWHVPDSPAITGRMAQLDHGQSRLFLDVVLPAGASLAVVDELTNPDPCDGSDPGCVPFGEANAGTFRIEVRHPQNPLFVPFLTVLQPGSNTSTAPANTQVASLDGKMIGVEIVQAGGAHSIALFNNQDGQVPPPITATSYNFPGSGVVSHTLMGLVPGALYSAVLTNGVVHVDQSPTGNETASPAGVLHFTLSSVVTTPTAPTGVTAAAVTTARVDVSWVSVSGATSYAVDRKELGGAFIPIGTPLSNSFSDTSATASTSYLYQVRALNSAGTSGPSAPDIATTVIFTNDPLTAGTIVQGVHLSQLRTAINAVRALANFTAETFTDPSPAGARIKSVHITELRSALDAALAPLGFPTGGYTNSPLSGVLVRAVDFQELRNRIQ